VATRGRRPVLDEIKQREILAILTVGCSRRTAARYVGCAVSTIQNTAERDPGFAEKLRRAENQHEWTYLRNIQQAAKKPQYWRAAAWVLERVFPEKYARRGPDVITLDQIRQALAQLAEIVVAEVPVARYRQKIIKRLEAITRSLCRPPQLEGTDHES
jgi:hypothetical protein